MEYYSVIKKEQNPLPFVATWMDWEGTVLSEINQTKKDKYCMISLICGILKKHNKLENITKKEAYSPYREQINDCQGVGRGRAVGWGIRVQTVGCKTGNKELLLYNRENIANIL